MGEEHTATSICQLVMSSYYADITPHIQDKLKIVAITSPNELHQVGLRMLADLLEMNGFAVDLLSANASIDDIIEALECENSSTLIISTTLQGNLLITKKLIKQVRKKSKDPHLNIFVGGQAYKQNQELKKYVGADYLATQVDDVISLLEDTKYAH